MAGVTVALLAYLSQHWMVVGPLLVLLATFWWWSRASGKDKKDRQGADEPAAGQRVQSVQQSQSQDSAAMRKNVIDFGGVGDSDEYAGDDLVPPAVPDDIAHIKLCHERRTLEESYTRSKQFYELMNKRRSVRFFSKEPVPKAIVENLFRTAGTAPSGAHTEPWRFVAVNDPDYKKQIRDIVEQEEEINYQRRMGVQWTADLKGMRTTHVKEYLTDAPWILLVFKQVYTLLPDGRKRNNYYHEISTALAGGLLLAAIQDAGLCTLTSTPLNCGPALKTLLQRPSHEKLLLLLPLGYPSKDCTVPDLGRKDLDEILTVF